MTRKPFQSKLLPYLEFIREGRAQQQSYPQIAAELRARFGISVAPSTIFAFVKVRSRRRSVVTLLSPEPVPSPASMRHVPRAAVEPTPPGASNGWRFYDPSKPLVKDPP